MDIKLAIVILAAALIWLLCVRVFYPLLLSPSAKLPLAHPLCAVTSVWFKRQCTQNRELKTLYAAHQKHGAIVRLSPNEVSVVSLEGLKKVYIGALDKGVWYQQVFYNYGFQNLVCTLDHKTHSEVRRMIAGLYSKSYLQRSVDMEKLSNQIIFDRCLPQIEDWAQRQEDVDVLKLFQWTSVDFITGYIFGTAIGTDFLRNKESRDRYFGEWDKLRESPQLSDKPISDAMYMDMCKAAISSQNDKSNSKDTRPLVMAKMYEEMSFKSKELDISKDKIMARCASEMVDQVIATQEANTITWTYILYRMSLHPELQDHLRAELQSLRPGGAVNLSERELASPSDIDNLPLLDAVIHETLRLHAANPARMQRVVPKDGLMLHGHHIPAGTTISTNAYCLHRNAEAFPEPLEWLPQRWIQEDSDKATASGPNRAEIMRKWFWAFGSGPRMCIGQNFAVQVIKLVVAAIYSQYSTTIVDDEGIEQADAYNSGPVGHRLILRFHKAALKVSLE